MCSARLFSCFSKGQWTYYFSIIRRKQAHEIFEIGEGDGKRVIKALIQMAVFIT